MIDWYVRQISVSRMTISDVPARWHDEVVSALSSTSNIS